MASRKQKMVAATESQVQPESKLEAQESTGIDYGAIISYNPEVFVEKFQVCPCSIFMRNGDISESRIEKMKTDLEVEEGYYQVLESIKWFELTQEQIDNWKLGEDVEPNTPYVMNGNTRLLAINDLVTGSGEYKIADIPTQQLSLEGKDEKYLYKLQITYNDTTVAHTTVQKARFIATLLQNKIDGGMKPSAAKKEVAEIMDVSAAYISHSGKFIDNPLTMSTELLNERALLFSYLDAGSISFDTCITIMQKAEKHELMYSYVLDLLAGSYKVELRPDKVLFSRNQVVDYFKEYESSDSTATAGASTATREELELDGNEPLTTTDSQDDDETDPDFLMSQTKREEVIDKIQAHSAGLRTELPPEHIGSYKVAASDLTPIIKRLVSCSQPGEYKEIFEGLSRIALKLLFMGEVTSKLEGKDLLYIQRKMESIDKLFNLEPTEDKPDLSQSELPI